MATPANADNITRFVASARRLIVIQVIVAVLALVATGVAVYFIYDALKRTDNAKATEMRARLATSQYESIVALTRPILQAKTPEEYRIAADALAEKPESIFTEDVYALLSAAYYKSAPPSDADGTTAAARYDALSLANTQSLKAIDASLARLARAQAGDEDSGAATSPDLYLEYAALQCALAVNPDPAADTGSSSVTNPSDADDSPAPPPEAVTDTTASPLDPLSAVRAGIERIKPGLSADMQGRLAEANVFEKNAMVSRECSPQLLAEVKAAFGVTEVSAPKVDEFAIRQIYVQVSSSGDRPLAEAIRDTINAVEGGPRIPGIEVMSGKIARYSAGVRYYHPEQAQHAETVRRTIFDAARAAGATWAIEAMPLVSLDLDIPDRSTIEVWLPEGSGQAPVQQTPVQQVSSSADKSEQLRVFYYQRSGDGDSVSSVLEAVLPRGSYSYESPQISGDRTNVMACNVGLSAAGFAQFKALALALIDNGVPLEFIKSYSAPAAKPVNRVEILRGNPPRPPLIRSDIEAMTRCPDPGLIVRRP